MNVVRSRMCDETNPYIYLAYIKVVCYSIDGTFFTYETESYFKRFSGLSREYCRVTNAQFDTELTAFADNSVRNQSRLKPWVATENLVTDCQIFFPIIPHMLTRSPLHWVGMAVMFFLTLSLKNGLPCNRKLYIHLSYMSHWLRLHLLVIAIYSRLNGVCIAFSSRTLFDIM
jgi:hypothetical protein